MVDWSNLGVNCPHLKVQEFKNKQTQEKQEPTTEQVSFIPKNNINNIDNMEETLSYFDYQSTLVKAEQGQKDSPKISFFLAIDTKDALSCLSKIWIHGLEELDETQLEVITRSDEKITDIYYQGVRYSLRYDAQGNIAKTIQMTFDEAGNVNRQYISEWNNGHVKTSTTYTYEYDEKGNQIGQTRSAVDSSYGSAFNILNKFFNANLICPCMLFGEDLQVQRTQDGKITDFTYGGTHYALRYDEDGTLSQTFTQKLDDEGRVVEHNITEYNKGGSVKDVKNYSYEYNTYSPNKVTTQRDENGNIIQKVLMDLDENGEVRGQNVENYNPDGSIKNIIYYSYSVNEAGEKIQSRTAVDSKYNPINLLGFCGVEFTGELLYYNHIPFIGAVPPPFYRGIENLERNQNGQITSFMYEGNRYSFQYDKNGNISKAVTQKLDDEGRVVEHNIAEYNKDGSVKDVKNYSYEYNTTDTSYIPNKVTTQRDENGNIIQKVLMDLDENGEVRGQNVENYNPDGSIKNIIYYSYSVNEAGEKIQSRTAVDSKYNPINLLGFCGVKFTGGILECDLIPSIGEVPPLSYRGIENLERNQNGQITSFMYEGNRYSFQYDKNGNISKAVTQKFYDEAPSELNQFGFVKRPVTQIVREFGPDGELIKNTKYTYEYDETTGERIGGTRTDLLNGGETIDTKQAAIDNIKELYSSAVDTDPSCQNESTKLNEFINNNVIQDLKNVGVTAQEMEDLLKELFPTISVNNDIASLQGEANVKTPTANIEDPYSLLKQLYNAYHEDAPLLNEKSISAFELLNDPNNKWYNHIDRAKVLGKLSALDLPSGLYQAVRYELWTKLNDLKHMINNNNIN